MNKVEEVARALSMQHWGTEDDWRMHVEDAKVAISAMRAPTNAMLVAGARNRTAPGRFFTGDDTLQPEWVAMIDAALEEGR